MKSRQSSVGIGRHAHDPDVKQERGKPLFPRFGITREHAGRRRSPRGGRTAPWRTPLEKIEPGRRASAPPGPRLCLTISGARGQGPTGATAVGTGDSLRCRMVLDLTTAELAAGQRVRAITGPPAERAHAEPAEHPQAGRGRDNVQPGRLADDAITADGSTVTPAAAVPASGHKRLVSL